MAASASSASCDICCEDFPISACYKCAETADCITVCATCFSTWGKPMCMKCNLQISRGDLVKWLSYKTFSKIISPYWAEIHVKHEKTLIPVVKRYLEWCEYVICKKRFARWGSQKYERGFVAKPELDDLDLSEFSSEELAMKMSGSEYYACTKADCKGQVIFSKCGGCKSSYCTKCREIITEQKNHECDPSILKSVQEVAASTKACPACRTSITKDGGCNDMRCTNCGVRFSWSTGNMVKINSNPLGDNEVFGLNGSKDEVFPMVAGTDAEATLTPSIDYILYKRDASAIVKYAMERFDSAKLNSKLNVDCLNLRVKFIKGEVDEERWGKQLVNMVDSRDSGIMIGDILLKHSLILTDKDSKDSWETKVSQAQEQLDYVAMTYNCKIPILKKERTNEPPVI